jgi:hypothetical protein
MKETIIYTGGGSLSAIIFTMPEKLLEAFVLGAVGGLGGYCVKIVISKIKK